MHSTFHIGPPPLLSFTMNLEGHKLYSMHVYNAQLVKPFIAIQNELIGIPLSEPWNTCNLSFKNIVTMSCRVPVITRSNGGRNKASVPTTQPTLGTVTTMGWLGLGWVACTLKSSVDLTNPSEKSWSIVIELCLRKNICSLNFYLLLSNILLIFDFHILLYLFLGRRIRLLLGRIFSLGFTSGWFYPSLFATLSFTLPLPWMQSLASSLDGSLVWNVGLIHCITC